ICIPCPGAEAGPRNRAANQTGQAGDRRSAGRVDGGRRMSFRIAELKHKNNKIIYYIQSVFKTELYPASWCRAALKSRLAATEVADRDFVLSRVAYYNQLRGVTPLSAEAIRIADIK